MNNFIAFILFTALQFQPVKMAVTPKLLHPGSPLVLNIYGLNPDTLYRIRFGKESLNITGSTNTTIFLGVDLAHPAGENHIYLYARGITSPIASDSVTIQSHAYPTQYLKLPQRMVNLKPDELKRALKEQAELDRIFENDRTKKLWKGRFIIPVRGIITTIFGVKRFLNGEPRSPHTGIDIAAKTGTPVVATNNGLVCFRGSTFFGGNSILIDHGQGIYSMYFHLERYAVKNKEPVKKGQVIGYLGDTGRTTGSDLHFGLRILNSRIDPELLFRLNPFK